MLRLFRFIVFMIFAIVSTAHAQNISIKEADARSWANNKGQELLLILSESNLTEKYAKLDRMMMEDVNIDYISKFVIGKYAKFMSNEQKTRYNELFQRYILSSYKQIDLHFDASLIKFTVDDIIEHPEFTTVKCTVDAGKLIKEADASIIPVKFKLIRGRFNRIQAVDLEIAKVSMVIEYRKRFYKMIQDEGGEIEWFLDKFDDRVRANEENVYKNASL